MITVEIPYLDWTARLTPLINEAVKAGAKADHHPERIVEMVLYFSTAKAADAFRNACGDLLTVDQAPSPVVVTEPEPEAINPDADPA